jgi:hypothetical protein
LVHDLHVFEVNLLLNLAYISFIPSLMPPLPSISALGFGRKLLNSLCEVIESDSRSIHEVLGDLSSSDNEVGEWMDSSDGGEIGKRIPVVDPNRLADYMYRHHHSHGEFAKKSINHWNCQRDGIAFNIDITCVTDHVPSFFKDAIIKPIYVDIKDADVLFASNNVDKLNDSSMPSEDLLSFVQSMTDVLDAATHDF